MAAAQALTHSRELRRRAILRATLVNYANSKGELPATLTVQVRFKHEHSWIDVGYSGTVSGLLTHCHIAARQADAQEVRVLAPATDIVVGAYK